MATVEELWFSSLEREVAAIDREVSRLEAAMGGRGGGEERGVVARRVEAAARALRRRLEQQSAPLWLLLQDPARQSQVSQIHARTRGALHRMVTMLGPGDASSADPPLAEKLGLKSDPWSSLVLLSSVLLDVVQVALRSREREAGQ